MTEHNQLRSKLVALASGTLSPAEETELRAHLAHCADCSHQLETWQSLVRSLQRVPETVPTPARLARIAARAEAHRQAVLERRWNRLVLSGLVIYGWMLFIVIVPLLPSVAVWFSQRLGLPWFGIAVLGLGVWWSFCWVIGLGLLPLLRAWQPYWREQRL